jgi:hypothetical protein
MRPEYNKTLFAAIIQKPAQEFLERAFTPRVRAGDSAQVADLAVLISVAVGITVRVGVAVCIAIYRTHARRVLVAVVVCYHAGVRRNTTPVCVGWNIRVRLNCALALWTAGGIGIARVRSRIGIVVGAAAVNSYSAHDHQRKRKVALHHYLPLAYL